MRNLTDDQAAELAYDLVRDHLLDGIEFLSIAESVDDSVETEDAVDGGLDEDYALVAGFVDTLMTKLADQLDNL